MEVKVTIGKGRAIKGRERKSNKRGSVSMPSWALYLYQHLYSHSAA
jgi:hypothetical protein